MRPTEPLDSRLDLAVAALASALLLLSLASAACVLLFRLRTSRRRRRLRGLNSLWPVRLLLVLFASLWALSELLRLPLLLRRLPLRPAVLCRAYTLSSQAFAEPCFLATLLFLLRASTRAKSPASTAAAFAAALAGTLLPFLALHVVFLSISTWDLRRLGLPPDVFGRSRAAPTPARCCCPLFGTVLLAALGAVYVPLFVSAGWGAVSVVINKRLRARLYALVVAVVGALSVQVAALALSALWSPGSGASQWLALVAFLAVLTCAAAGEVILVFHPIVDALAIREAEQASVVRLREEDDVGGGGVGGKGVLCSNGRG